MEEFIFDEEKGIVLNPKFTNQNIGIGLYKGKHVEDMTKEELIQALYEMSSVYQKELNTKF